MDLDQAVTAPRAIGVGCRRDCPAETIVVLVREALARTGQGAPTLFTVDDKAGEPGLVQAAATLGIGLVALPHAALEAEMDRVLTRSAVAARALGLASVSEAAALAGAGPDSWLILPRIARGGATCAVAVKAEGA